MERCVQDIGKRITGYMLFQSVQILYEDRGVQRRAGALHESFYKNVREEKKGPGTLCTKK